MNTDNTPYEVIVRFPDSVDKARILSVMQRVKDQMVDYNCIITYIHGGKSNAKCHIS